MQGSWDPQRHSTGTPSSQSMAARQDFAYPQLQPMGASFSQGRQEIAYPQQQPMGASFSQGRQESAYPQQQPVGASLSQGRQAVVADDLHSEGVLSQRTEPTGDARLHTSQPAEEDVRRGEGFESSGPVPQQEMSLRDLASAGSASEPESNDVGRLDQQPITSRSIDMAEHVGNDGMPLQLSFTPPQEQQQQQSTQQLRQQPSGNPFQAAAMSANAPAGDEQLPGRFMGIPPAANTVPASPDNPFAPSAAPDDAGQPLVGNSTIPSRDLGPGTSSCSHSGVVAIPRQQSGTLSVPEQHQESIGPQVQAEQAAGQAAAGSLESSLQGSHGNAVSVPGSSMHTATSIAQLLADLPPAGK